MNLYFSFIIPVFNRPDEIKELLDSLSKQSYPKDYEIVIIEDGSDISSEEVVSEFSNQLNISYYYKSNSGPGDSRNYGMKRAHGNYYLVLDSDCIIPPNYLKEVENSLLENYVDCFGGPDAAHESFSNVQKAINYSMTSFLTTGGIRGGKTSVNKFQPRSFNMGISKKAFEATNGFGKIHPGEDPDLTIRLWKAGFETKLIQEAFVYHKRRISWNKFKVQVRKFGLTRPILNSWHPETRKITFWFPSLFMLGSGLALIGALLGNWFLMFFYVIYFLLIFIDSTIKNKNIYIGLLSIYAVVVQFYGYGTGFIKSTFYIDVLKKEPEMAFPKLFFK